MRLHLVYFAWVRERIGKDGESLDFPGSAITVAGVIRALAARGPGYASAFEDLSCLRFACDQEFIDIDASIHDGAELAIFPPVTGGMRRR